MPAAAYSGELDEAEYQEASKRLTKESRRFEEHCRRLKQLGLSELEMRRVIDPLESFHLQLKDEVEAYERLQRGRTSPLGEETRRRRELSIAQSSRRLALGTTPASSE